MNAWAASVGHGVEFEVEPYALVPLQSKGSITLRMPALRADGTASSKTAIEADAETTVTIDRKPTELFGTLLPAAHLRAGLGYGPFALQDNGTHLQLEPETRTDDLRFDLNAKLIV